MQYDMLVADRVIKTKYIGFFDTDTAVVTQVTKADLFDGDKPIIIGMYSNSNGMFDIDVLLFPSTVVDSITLQGSAITMAVAMLAGRAKKNTCSRWFSNHLLNPYLSSLSAPGKPFWASVPAVTKWFLGHPEVSQSRLLIMLLARSTAAVCESH